MDEPAHRDPESDPAVADTSFHARRAIRGDRESLGWIVERVTPLLVIQAERRLSPVLRRHCDPEDLVAETWATTLPNLGDLDLQHDHYAAVLIKYASTVLLGCVRNLARKQARRGGAGASDPASSRADPLAQLPDAASGVVTRMLRSEQRGAVWELLHELDPADRDVIIYRGIEQLPQKEVAALMGLQEGTVAVRYHRALRKLRELLPRSVFDDLPD